MASFAYPGPHCKQAGILCDTLVSARKQKKFSKGTLTKGVLLELNDFCKEHDISWDLFHQWIGGEEEINLSSLKVSIS